MPPLVRTLRFRLALAFFIWTGLFQLGLAIALPLAREVFVRREVEHRLDEAVPEIVRVLRESKLGDIQSRLSSADLDRAGLAIEVRDEADKVVGSTAHAQLFAGNPANDTIIKARNSSSEQVERYQVAVTSANVDDQTVTIYAALSLAAFDRLHRALIAMLAAGLTVGLIGSAVGGWMVSGVVVSRVNRVAKAVREVSPTRLDERVEIPAGEDEIGQMTKDLNKMLERMAVAFRSQERFMSEVSHELKTPLSALLAEAQVLKQMRAAPRYSVPGIDPKMAAETRRLLEPYERFVLSVEEEMRWLGKLVESFLMLARFGHGKQFVTETLVPMNDVVLDAVEHSTLYARQHGVKLALTLYDAAENEPEAMIRGDNELLRVVSDNLIRNAVQFSKKGDSVFIRLAYEHAAAGVDHGMLVLTVKDQGPGVPPDYVERIFDRFQQAPGKAATRRGSGLGLTISKSIVDLHGGTIDLRNDPEGGCTFRVRLPLKPLQPAPQPTGERAPEPVHA